MDEIRIGQSATMTSETRKGQSTLLRFLWSGDSGDLRKHTTYVLRSVAPTRPGLVLFFVAIACFSHQHRAVYNCTTKNGRADSPQRETVTATRKE